MSIHREGYTIIAVTIALLLLVNLIFYWLVSGNIWRILFSIASLAFLVLVIQFFRNPVRATSINPKHIIAPADGKVVIIENAEEPEYFKGTRKQISIFMSPLNVHVNRNPVSGKVNYYKYHEGKYLVAWHPKSSTLNERTTVVVETPEGIEVLYRQIAGAVARRIVCYIDKDHEVKQGEEYGFIKFGSRIDLFLPTDIDVKVNLEQKVVGGETVIAAFN